MFALMPYLTLYLQNDLGYSPLGGGLRLLPMTILTFAVPFIFRSPISTLPPGAVLGGGIAISAAGIAALLAVGPTLAGRSSSRDAALRLGHRHCNPAIARVVRRRPA